MMLVWKEPLDGEICNLLCIYSPQFSRSNCSQVDQVVEEIHQLAFAVDVVHKNGSQLQGYSWQMLEV